MSIAGGLPNAVRRAVAAGCGVVQLFLRNQLRWAGLRLEEDEVARNLATLRGLRRGSRRSR